MAKKVPISRVVSGAALIVLLVVAVYLGGWFLTAGAIILPFFLLYDVLQVIKAAGKKPYAPLLYLQAALLFPAYEFFGAEGVLFLYMAVLMLIFLYALFDRQYSFENVLYTVLAMLYPLLPAGALLYLTRLNDPMQVSIFIVIACLYPSLADMGGYFSGMLFGKKPLCPKISPKKTVAGSVGAFLAPTIFGILAGWAMNQFVYDGISFIHYIILGMLCGVFAQVGDLSASMLKRHCGVKDFGTYIPGQGGTMDRFDSILACGMVVFVYAKMLL